MTEFGPYRPWSRSALRQQTPRSLEPMRLWTQLTHIQALLSKIAHTSFSVRNAHHAPAHESLGSDCDRHNITSPLGPLNQDSVGKLVSLPLAECAASASERNNWAFGGRVPTTVQVLGCSEKAPHAPQYSLDPYPVAVNDCGAGEFLAQLTISQEISPTQPARLAEHITTQLSGARLRRPNRSYFILTHRRPPKINEDDVACPLERFNVHGVIELLTYSATATNPPRSNARHMR